MPDVTKKRGPRVVIPPTCDVAVIGAGLAGALVARKLAEAGLRVVILEAQPHLGGVAGRAAGVALLGTPESYLTLREQRGAPAAREMWHMSRYNLELGVDELTGRGIPYQTPGSLRPVRSSAEAMRVQMLARHLADEGFAVELADATELGFDVALKTGGDLLFDPVALTQAFLDHPHIILQTGTEVHTLTPDGEEIEIWAKKHYLRAKAAVLTGGAHVVHLSKYLADNLTALPFHTVDCEAANPPPLPIILNEGRLLLYARAQHWRLVGWAAGPEQEPLSLLVQATEEFCPEGRVVQRMSGWVARSRDGLPLVGELPDLPRVYTIAGLGPWGLSWVFVAVERLLGLMLRDDDPGVLGIRRLRSE